MPARVRVKLCKGFKIREGKNKNTHAQLATDFNTQKTCTKTYLVTNFVERVGFRFQTCRDQIFNLVAEAFWFIKKAGSKFSKRDRLCLLQNVMLLKE